jgi:hypothetical protein
VTEGAASWCFRYRVNGRLREMGLGLVHTVSLAEARQKARECRKARLEGRDPIEERRAGRLKATLDAAKAMTFKACAKAYIAAHQTGWRSAKHAAQGPASPQAYAFPVIGSLSVQATDVGLVMRAIEGIWQTKPETASRVRGRIEAILDWATAQGENPARWKGHLENLLPKVKSAKATVRRQVGRSEHFAALPHAELPAFMAELREQEGVAVRALEFVVLTACRGEALGATWSELGT